MSTCLIDNTDVSIDLLATCVQASDAAGGTTRDPLGAPADAPQYRGAAISVAEEANSVIPVLYW
jgi:hypothetical protein